MVYKLQMKRIVCGDTEIVTPLCPPCGRAIRSANLIDWFANDVLKVIACAAATLVRHSPVAGNHLVADKLHVVYPHLAHVHVVVTGSLTYIYIRSGVEEIYQRLVRESGGLNAGGSRTREALVAVHVKLVALFRDLQGHEMPSASGQDTRLVSSRVVLIEVQGLQIAWLSVPQLAIGRKIEALSARLATAKGKNSPREVILHGRLFTFRNFLRNACGLQPERDGRPILQLHAIEWIRHHRIAIGIEVKDITSEVSVFHCLTHIGLVDDVSQVNVIRTIIKGVGAHDTAIWVRLVSRLGISITPISTCREVESQQHNTDTKE